MALTRRSGLFNFIVGNGATIVVILFAKMKGSGVFFLESLNCSDFVLGLILRPFTFQDVYKNKIRKIQTDSTTFQID